MRRLIAPAAFAACALLAACGGGGSVGSPAAPLPPAAPPVAPASPAPLPTVAGIITGNLPLGSSFFAGAIAPDGRVWFGDDVSGLVAVTASGVVTPYPVAANIGPQGIVVGGDGNIWVGGFDANAVYRVTTYGAVTPFVDLATSVGGMTLGPDGNVWFTDFDSSNVESISPAGTIASYPVPNGAHAYDITRGPDGNLWATAIDGEILRITPSGVFTSFTNGITEHPQGIVTGPDGNLYFTETAFSASTPDKVERITPSGNVTELGTVSNDALPFKLAVGKDGNIYFTEQNLGNLGKITVASGAVSEVPLGIGKGIRGIVAAPDGRLWLGGQRQIYEVSY